MKVIQDLFAPQFRFWNTSEPEATFFVCSKTGRTRRRCVRVRLSKINDYLTDNLSGFILSGVAEPDQGENGPDSDSVPNWESGARGSGKERYNRRLIYLCRFDLFNDRCYERSRFTS